MEEKNILTNLPVDVLERIMKHLPLKDVLRLRAICRSCRKAVSNAIENKHCCHLPELPRLSSKSLTSVKGWLRHTNKSLLRCTDECRGSVEGWLIVSDNSEKGFAKIFFLNPVTDVRIMIPSKLYLPIVDDRILFVKKLVASSKPNCDGSDCYLVGLLSDNRHIAIYKLFEKSWTIVEADKDSRTYFMDIEITGTKLYVNDPSSNSILLYDLKDSTDGPPKAEVLVECPRRRPPGSSKIDCFLVKHKTLRELYFIRMFYNAEIETRRVFFIFTTTFAKPPEITSFEVFKLDTNKSSIGWQNVKLEDKVAFVSNWNCMVMKRDECTYNKELIRDNSIYFADSFACHRINTPITIELLLGMFCLNDSSIKYFSKEKLKHGDVRYPLWFVPSLWQFHCLETYIYVRLYAFNELVGRYIHVADQLDFFKALESSTPQHASIWRLMSKTILIV